MSKVVEIKADLFDVIKGIEDENERHKTQLCVFDQKRIELLTELAEEQAKAQIVCCEVV